MLNRLVREETHLPAAQDPTESPSIKTDTMTDRTGVMTPKWLKASRTQTT